MPFDDPNAVPVVPEFKTGKEGLKNLAYVLRHPELWPHHKWDYGTEFEPLYKSCKTVGCAIGVATVVWPGHEIRDELMMGGRIPVGVIEDIFYCSGTYQKNWVDITPLDVANAIDRYLNGERIQL